MTAAVTASELESLKCVKAIFFFFFVPALILAKKKKKKFFALHYFTPGCQKKLCYDNKCMGCWEAEPQLRVQTDLAVLAQPLQADDCVLPQLQLLIDEQS